MTAVAVRRTSTSIITRKAQKAGVFIFAVVRRRTPIVAVLPFATATRIVIPTCRRQKDAVAVLLASHFITVLATQSSPLPSAFMKKFIKFSLGRESSGAAPFFAGNIVAATTLYPFPSSTHTQRFQVHR